MTLGGVISYDPTPKKIIHKINLLKNLPFSDLWGVLEGNHNDKEWALAPASPDRPQTSPAGTLLVPLSSASPRRIDPLWGRCPPLPAAAAPPLGLQGRGVFQKSFCSSPAGAKWSGRGWRFACKSTPEPATAQRAECLLRSPMRGPVRSKAIRARHGEAVASGHSFSDFGAIMAAWACPPGA